MKSYQDENEKSVWFSIITPTYNRAHTLTRVYESLCQQSRRDFEWIVVDDESTDGTAALIANLSNDADFPIRYAYQKHGHKKVALNHGIRLARGEMALLLDSDDMIVPKALEYFVNAWEGIPAAERDQYSGIWGLCVDEAGNIVGDEFPTNDLDITTSEFFYRYRLKGEKFACDRVDILKQYPYPEDIKGFVIEQVVWADISRKYKRLGINAVVRVYHDSQDSISNQTMNASLINDCEGILYSYNHLLNSDADWFWAHPMSFIRYAANRKRFTIHYYANGGKREFKVRGWRAKVISVAFGWLGLLLCVRDIYKTKSDFYALSFFIKGLF